MWIFFETHIHRAETLTQHNTTLNISSIKKSNITSQRSLCTYRYTQEYKNFNVFSFQPHCIFARYCLFFIPFCNQLSCWNQVKFVKFSSRRHYILLGRMLHFKQGLKESSFVFSEMFTRIIFWRWLLSVEG